MNPRQPAIASPPSEERTSRVLPVGNNATMSEIILEGMARQRFNQLGQPRGSRIPSALAQGSLPSCQGSTLSRANAERTLKALFRFDLRRVNAPRNSSKLPVR